MLAVVLASTATPQANAEQTDANAIPHVNQRARDAYLQQYLQAPGHRAFAIAPGGAWAWADTQDTPAAARAAALLNCREYTEQTCVLYALDDRVVFDRAGWPKLWDIEPGEARSKQTGTRRGQQFPDIRYLDTQGATRSVHDLRGKIVLLHFWGSWCPPCLRELPALNGFLHTLETQLGDSVAVVLLQMRESIDTSRQWIREHGFEDLPLSDSGAMGIEHDYLHTTTGARLPDRHIARVFPSSYVLDQNGRVLFSHTGPIDDWNSYLIFFEHAVTQLKSNTASSR